MTDDSCGDSGALLSREQIERYSGRMNPDELGDEYREIERNNARLPAAKG